MQNIPTKTSRISSSSYPSCPSYHPCRPYSPKIYEEQKAEESHVPGYVQHEVEEISLVQPLVAVHQRRHFSKDLSRDLDLVRQAALKTAHSAVDPLCLVKDVKARRLVGVVEVLAVVEVYFSLGPY
jgi:hypothetical protein